MRFKVVLPIVFILAIVVGYFFYSKYSTGLLRSKTLKIEESIGLLKKGESVESVPAELGDGFNPTKNQAGFEILSIESDAKKANLKYIYPDSRGGIVVSSKISCKSDDFSLVEGGGTEPKKVSEEVFWQKIKQSSEDTNIIYGMCNDENCTEVNRQCNLYIPGVESK